MKSHTRSNTLLFVTLVLLTTATQAHAYVDGGSASMAWQIVVAGSLGVVFMIRGFWSNLMLRFKGKGKAVAAEQESRQNETA